MFPCCA
jgi:hypothetical protein